MFAIMPSLFRSLGLLIGFSDVIDPEIERLRDLALLMFQATRPDIDSVLAELFIRMIARPD
jgi:hypothetical protein